MLGLIFNLSYAHIGVPEIKYTDAVNAFLFIFKRQKQKEKVIIFILSCRIA